MSTDSQFVEADVNRGHEGHAGRFTWKNQTQSEVGLGSRSGAEAGFVDYSEWLADEDRLPLVVQVTIDNRVLGKSTRAVTARALSDDEMRQQFLNRRMVEEAQSTETDATLGAVHYQMDEWQGNLAAQERTVLISYSGETTVTRPQTADEVYLDMLRDTKREADNSAAAERRYAKWVANENRVSFRSIDRSGVVSTMTSGEVREMIHTVEGFDTTKKALFYQNPQNMLWNGTTAIDITASTTSYEPDVAPDQSYIAEPARELRRGLFGRRR